MTELSSILGIVAVLGDICLLYGGWVVRMDEKYECSVQMEWVKVEVRLREVLCDSSLVQPTLN